MVERERKRRKKVGRKGGKKERRSEKKEERGGGRENKKGKNKKELENLGAFFHNFGVAEKRSNYDTKNPDIIKQKDL